MEIRQKLNETRNEIAQRVGAVCWRSKADFAD